MVEVLDGFLYDGTMSVCAHIYPPEKRLNKRHVGLCSEHSVVDEAGKNSLTLLLETITPPPRSLNVLNLNKVGLIPPSRRLKRRRDFSKHNSKNEDIAVKRLTISPSLVATAKISKFFLNNETCSRPCHLHSWQLRKLRKQLVLPPIHPEKHSLRTDRRVMVTLVIRPKLSVPYK